MTPHTPIAPGQWLGLLGGGQLGRMFAMAAQSLGYRVCVLDPGADCPAAAVADAHVQADYLDDRGLQQLADQCRAASTEFENVPAAALQFLARHCEVSPSADAVAIAQDRVAEKRFIAACGAPVAPHAVITTDADCAGIGAELLPGILKSARLGYDGKGQVRVRTAAEVLAAFAQLGRVPCVLEKMLPLALEVSVVVCRNRDDQTVSFPVAENVHRDGILAVSRLPARIDETLARRAREVAMHIAREMNYVGVLCVEFFVLADGALVVNEMAPRPHNSGHATIDACTTSQFEQQARVMAGLPLGDTTQLAPAVMLNLLGDLWFNGDSQREPDWAGVLAIPGAKLHLYGKTEARRGRKMGHITCLGSTAAQALERANQVATILGLPAAA
ncbi:MAG: 5-(carboxyamino)imidazole ribonucleotide synthase [Burkholderiaceae bacterium]